MNDKQFNLLRWTPTAISVALMVLIAVVAVRTVSRLKKATYWREHTFQVILDAQSFEDKLLDAQSGVDHYVESRTPNLLLEYKSDTDAERRELGELSHLTRDNPAQQECLRALSTAMKAVFECDDRLIAIYGQTKPQTATQVEKADQEKQVVNAALKGIESFKDTEQKLLGKRDNTEQIDYHKAARLLIVASILAAVLLAFTNFFASREMARRRLAEFKQRELIAELQKTLSEVKTLSGLIPICGWCKQVRSDTGYWQTVEQYVRAHTGAKFTHGVCPACAEKWKTEIEKPNAA